MQKIEIPMTKTQCQMIRKITDGTNFALISQPLVYGEKMKVLILTPKEFRVMNKFFMKFIPKELRK